MNKFVTGAIAPKYILERSELYELIFLFTYSLIHFKKLVPIPSPANKIADSCNPL